MTVRNQIEPRFLKSCLNAKFKLNFSVVQEISTACPELSSTFFLYFKITFYFNNFERILNYQAFLYLKC